MINIFPKHEKLTEISPRAEKVAFRLSAEENKMLLKRFKQEGYETRVQWIRATILRALFGEVLLTTQEISVLQESSRQLSLLGRNLNQIAHALNIDFRESDKLKFELVAELKGVIHSHLKNVLKLIRKKKNPVK